MSDGGLVDLKKRCITSINSCLVNVSKYSGDEVERDYETLGKIVEFYCVSDYQQHVAHDALEIAKKETTATNIDNLEKRFKKHLESLAGKRQQITSHPYMKEFKKLVNQQRATAKQNFNDSDIAITQSKNDYIDPISKRPMETPMKNLVCGHVYDLNSIMGLIKVKTGTRCPVVGCANKTPVTREQLVLDEELKFQISLVHHSTMNTDKSMLNLDDTM